MLLWLYYYYSKSKRNITSVVAYASSLSSTSTNAESLDLLFYCRSVKQLQIKNIYLTYAKRASEFEPTIDLWLLWWSRCHCASINANRSNRISWIDLRNDICSVVVPADRSAASSWRAIDDIHSCSIMIIIYYYFQYIVGKITYRVLKTLAVFELHWKYMLHCRVF